MTRKLASVWSLAPQISAAAFRLKTHRPTAFAGAIVVLICSAVCWSGCGKSGEKPPDNQSQSQSNHADANGPRPGDKWIDVTAQAEARLTNGNLLLDVNNGLAGTDPAPGKFKYSRIEFRLNGKFQAAVLTEGRNVELPRGAQFLHAYYGLLPPDKSVATLDTPLLDRSWMDLTDRIRVALAPPPHQVTVDYQLAGQDPAPGVVKHLQVVFQFNNQLQTNDVTEGATLNLPEGAVVLNALYGDMAR